MHRPISNDLMHFHRKEEMRKLKTILKSILAFRRVDSFRVMTGEADPSGQPHRPS